MTDNWRRMRQGLGKFRTQLGAPHGFGYGSDASEGHARASSR